MKPKQDLIIEIDGGLGNQLFMFYAGLFLAEKLDKKIVFDLSRLKKINHKITPHTISTLGMLNGFDTRCSKKLQITSLKSLYIQKKLFEKLSFKPKNSITKNLFQSGEVGFIADAQIPKEAKFIKGYFQTWRYFELLRNKPILSYSTLEKPTQWLDFNLTEIKKVDPFVLHVRRGDYRDTKNRRIGCLSLNYFEKVIEKFGTDREIWVFSDSIESVHDEFKELSKRVKFVKPPRESDPVESLILMSNASKLAISNSTFSWWAAKLGDQHSTVIAPEKWFKDRPDPLDLLPESWIKARSLWLN